MQRLQQFPQRVNVPRPETRYLLSQQRPHSQELILPSTMCYALGILKKYLDMYLNSKFEEIIVNIEKNPCYSTKL